MLSHGSAAADGSRYYKEDYYTQGHSPGFWAGDGAEALGLSGPVEDPSVLDKGLQGELPDGTIMPGPKGGGERRRGDDWTFSPPKSVSLVALVGKDSRVVEAHDRAVKATLRYMESEMFGSRAYVKGVQEHVHAGAIIGAFRHETSRAVDGISDPQLHTHCVWLNAALRQDGTWRAVDWTLASEAKRTADAVYLSQLAADLQRFGYELRATKDAYEIEGIPESALDHFGRRATQIEKELAKLGRTRENATAAQRQAACLRTRSGKEHLPKDEQVQEWRGRANEIHLSVDGLVQRSHDRAPTAGNEFEKSRIERAQGALEGATRHLAERHSVFTDRRLSSETVRAGVVDGVTLEDAHGAVLQGAQGKGKELVATDTPGVLTTRSTIESELEVRAIGQRGIGSVEALLNRQQTARFVHAYERTQKVTLTRGQHQAVFQVLTANDRVVIVEGHAGTGKTLALHAIREGAEKEGFTVTGLAPSAAAAREMYERSGIDSTTVARWAHLDPEEHGPHLYVVDEAGMVSTRDMLTILQRAEAEGSRVALVGDPRQLSSVEAGAPLRALIEQGVPAVTLEEIIRQRDPKAREMVAAYARGEVRTGANMATTYFHETDDIAKSAATDYLGRDPETRERTLIVSSTNMTRQAINEQVREGLRGEKRLGPDVQVRTLQRIDLTREETARARSYQEGNVVIPRTDYHQRGVSSPLLRGEEYHVVEVHDKHVVLEQRSRTGRISWDPRVASKVNYYREEVIPVARGDRVIFRENSRVQELQVVNGDRGTVTEADPSSVTVKRDRDGEEVHVGTDQGVRMQHSYATTVHGSQGLTVDHVIIAGETGELASAETAYVALSRESESITVYTRDPDRLREAWSTEKGQENALDHMGLDKARAWERARNQEGEVPTLDRERPLEKPIQHDDKEIEL